MEAWMIKWEYRVETIPNHDVVAYIDALNILGDEGWGLISEMMCSDVDESVVTLMRARPFEIEEICDN